VYVTPVAFCSTRVPVGVVDVDDVPPDVVPPPEPELPDVVPPPELVDPEPDVVPPPELVDPEPDVVPPPELVDPEPDVVPPPELVDPEPDVPEDDCKSTMNVSIRVAHPNEVSAPSVPSQ
jgi:fused signal recognition particle receptor